MPDRQTDEMRRKLEADPNNSRLRVDYYNRRAQIEGPAALFDILENRNHWKHCPETLQDLIIHELNQRLGRYARASL